jgi:hypothetical protein
MNRFFPNKLNCCFIGCAIICLLNQPSMAKVENQSNYKPKPKASHANINKELILVPPPPPGQSSLLDWPGIGDMPDSISYLNTEELNLKLEHVRKQINNAKSQVKDSELQYNESKDKAQSFNGLYSEGVISRKELESTKKEVADKERLADDAKSNLADLEIQESAIVRQLNLRKHKSKTTHLSLNKNTKEHKSK